MVWATSVNMPAGATVGGKTEAQIGAEVQAALAAGNKSKLESIMNSLHNAGYSGSFNASQEFKDVGVSNQSMGIVPASVAASPAATAAYVEENQMGPSATAQTGEPNYLDYVLNNPGLRENAEAHGYTQQEMTDFGDWHWNKYGQGESRRNTPFKTELPGERAAQMNPVEAAAFEASVRRGDPSEMWSARAAIDPAWNVGQFSGQGWNVDPDNPYMRGILGDNIRVDAPVGQLWSEGDPRFLQDRYLDPSIAQDFPVGWTTPQNAWAGPEQLGGYWDALTNAQRNEAGEIRSMVDRPAAGWAGPSVAPGTRGSGNIRVDGGNIRAAGGGLLNPTVPTFRGPGYQDWTRFMPTDFQLAEFGGMHYQPGRTGIPAGMGGGAGGFAGPDLPPGYNIGGGGPGVTYNPPTGFTPPGTGGGATGNVTTDTSGNKWVMSPGGQWIPAGSDYANALSGTGPYSSSLDPNFYDSSGAFMGAEDAGIRSDQIYDSPDPATRKAVGWGGGAFTPQEWSSDIAGPVAPRYDQWGNEVDMGNRQVGLNITKAFTGWMDKGGPFAGVKSILGAFQPSTSSGVVSAQPRFSGYPNMDVTYPGIMAPRQDISVAPNVDYGPHVSQMGTGNFYPAGVHPGILEAEQEARDSAMDANEAADIAAGFGWDY